MFIDATNHTLSDRQSAGIVLHRDWVTATMLQARGLTYAYVAIGERVIAEAIKFDFYDIALDIIVKVKGVYATQIGGRKKYDYYDNLFKKCFEIVSFEYRAREIFEKIRIEFVQSARFQPKLAIVAKEGYEELKPAMEKYDSFYLHFLGRAIEALQYSCVNDYAKLLVVEESTIAFFKQKPFECRPPLASACQTKTMCCIALKKYEEGEKAIKEAIAVSDEGSVNWFKSLELQTILYLHTGRYREAYDIYAIVKKHLSKKYLQETYQEMWLLIEAYLYFLIVNDFVPNVDVKKADLGAFKLQKFLNDMTLYGADKAGLNIPTLIVKVLLMLSEKKYDRIIDYMEPLVKYRTRHVSKEGGSYRSNEFIKVLEQLTVTSFHHKRFELATQRHINNIKTVPVNIFNDGFKLEMVPFENVWELLLVVLAKNK